MSEKTANPPCSNKGGNENSTSTTWCIDWLSYTMFPPCPDLSAVLKLCLFPHSSIVGTGELIAPRHGYDHAMKLTIGRIDWSDRAKQGVNVQFSGADCGTLVEKGINPLSVIRWVIDESGKVTRLDVAIDYHAAADIQALADAYEHGNVETRAHTCKIFKDVSAEKAWNETPMTIYFGSSASDCQLRVYNKAAERGVTGCWTRLELTTRADRARALADAMLANEAGAVIASAIRQHTNASLPWYQAATVSAQAYRAYVSRKPRDTYKWVCEICLPALEALVARGDDDSIDVMQRMVDIVAKYAIVQTVRNKVNSEVSLDR